MNENAHPETTRESPACEESTGDEKLDQRLSEPVLKGDRGIDVAQVWIGAFLIAMAGAIVYSTAWGVLFIGEVSDVLRDTPEAHRFTSAWNAAAALGVSRLIALTFGLNWIVTPNNAAGFAVVNALVHILNGVLVYLLARRLLRGQTHEAIAMLAGLLFVLNPIASQSVNAILPRGTVLATFFVLLSLLLYVHSVNNGNAALRPLGFVLSLLSFLLACACTKAAWAFPLLAAVVDWVVWGRNGLGSRVRPLVAYWGVLIAGVVAWRASGHAFTADIFRSYWDAPSNALAIVRDFPGTALALSDEGARQNGAYFPSAGAALVLPWAVQALPKIAAVRVAAGLAAVALLGAAGVATFQRNQLWQDPMALWSDTLDKRPDYAVAHEQIGLMLLAEARPAAEQLANQPNIDFAKDARLSTLRDAESHLLDAVKGGARTSRTLSALGTAQRLLGQSEEAMAHQEDALRSDESNQDAALELARLHQVRSRAQGHRDDIHRAMDYYRYATSLGPISREASGMYAIALVEIGDYDAALPLLKQAIGDAKDSPYAPLLQQLSKRAEQVALLEKRFAEFQHKAPTPEGAFLLAQILAMRGRYMQAAFTLQDFMELDPANRAAWALLGYVRARMRQAESFQKQSIDAPAAAAPESWTLLARQCAAEGMWQEAQAYLESPGAVAAGVAHPLVVLGDAAVEFHQPQLAADLYRQAADERPDDPVPWLKQCDLALTAKRLDVARSCLAEAERRGATADDLAKRREQLGDAPSTSMPQTGRVVLQ